MQVGAANMLGTIRSRHVLTHAPLIVRLFGLKAWLRCVRGLLHPTETTFLTSVRDSFTE